MRHTHVDRVIVKYGSGRSSEEVEEIPSAGEDHVLVRDEAKPVPVEKDVSNPPLYERWHRVIVQLETR